MPGNDADFHDSLSRLESTDNGKNDTDLGGMDPSAAAEYVLAFVTTLKETERAREDAEKQKALWESRVRLAHEKNEELLAAQAHMKVREIDEKLASLKAEEAELRRKVDFMKDELKRLKRMPTLSLDPEALLAQLEMISGQPDTTAARIKDTEADLELERLKKKIEDEGK